MPVTPYGVRWYGGRSIVPNGYLGLNRFPAQRAVDGHPMVTVAHVVGVADLNELNWRQRGAGLQRIGHALPALARLIRERIELVVETLRPAFGAADIGQVHLLAAGIVTR